MKTTILWLLLASCLCTTLQSQTDIQQKRWVLEEQKVDIQTIISESYNTATDSLFVLGPLVENGTKRYLYQVKFNSNNYVVLKSEITSTGINPAAIVYSSSIGLDFKSIEIALSSNGSMLAFANANTGTSSNDIIIVHLNPVTGNLATTTGNQGNGTSIFNLPDFDEAFTGVEFSPNGKNLFVGQVGVGIFKIVVARAGIEMNSTIIGTANHGNTRLDLICSPTGGYNIYAGLKNSDGTYNFGMIQDPNSCCPTFQNCVAINIKLEE